MPKLIVRKADGSLLFDTNNITYGLVKSGYLAYSSSWTRMFLKSNGLDPNDPASWNKSVQVIDSTKYDQLWSFTVTNAKSPIVFLVGPGCLSCSTTSGASITYHYTNASASTKFYCFDLMADNIAGSPFLKTFNSAGVLTFNSLQVPLNIVGTYTPPGPTAPTGTYGVQNAYNGGVSVPRFTTSDWMTQKTDCVFDVALTAGVEYAAHLPWSRGAGLCDGNGIAGAPYYSVEEGAYGRVGGISFMFGAAAGGTVYTATAPRPYGYYQVPSDRIPAALIITTSNLPFPFG